MLAVALILFLATFVQSSIGFGLALVAMPLLVTILGIQVAAPMVAVVAMIAEVVILARYREAFDFKIVMHLVIGAIVGIPIGIFAVRTLDGAIVTRALGVLVLGYALYALAAPALPALAWRGWEYLFGFFAGVLGGAYNTGGPPVVIYGNCRRWPPEEFKSDLQGFFLVTGLVVFASHALSGNLTSAVWQNVLYALPGMALGLVAGFLLSKRIRPELFHRLVLFALIGLGVKLVFF